MSKAAQARTELATALAERLTVEVVPYGVSRRLTAPLIMVRMASVGPGVVKGIRVHTLTVDVISAKTEPGTSDDELDQLLEQVLDALDDTNQVVFTNAERAIYEDGQPAYTITVTRED